MSPNYPVVVFLYKRPKLTKSILDKIIDSGATKIYLFSDAAKRSQDQAQVSEVRLILKEYIHSYPQLRFVKHYSKNNLGLQRSIEKGVSEVLRAEKVAIFLEDDCIPHPDFFLFVREMLDKYENEPRVMSVTGSGAGEHSLYSYDFSKYQQCWGWATWARSWEHFDWDMIGLDSREWQAKSKLIWPNIIMRYYWSTMLRLTKVGQVKSWAFRWSYAHLKYGGLAILPSRNLISNTGFDRAATNTFVSSPLANMATSPISFPLKNPNLVVENVKLSRHVEKYYYNNLIAILGMIRQLFYYLIGKYAHRT